MDMLFSNSNELRWKKTIKTRRLISRIEEDMKQGIENVLVLVIDTSYPIEV